MSMMNFWGKLSRATGEKEGGGRDKRVLTQQGDEMFAFDSCYSSQQGFLLDFSLLEIFFFSSFDFCFTLLFFVLIKYVPLCLSLCFSSLFFDHLSFLFLPF